MVVQFSNLSGISLEAIINEEHAAQGGEKDENADRYSAGPGAGIGCRALDGAELETAGKAHRAAF